MPKIHMCFDLDDYCESQADANTERQYEDDNIHAVGHEGHLT